MDGIQRHALAEGERGQNGQFVRGIVAVHIGARIGLGVAQLLGLGQDCIKVGAVGRHLGQDVVGGAVDNADGALEAVGAQGVLERLDDGNAAAGSRFE